MVLFILLLRKVIIDGNGVDVGASCSFRTGYFNVFGGSAAKFITV